MRKVKLFTGFTPVFIVVVTLAVLGNRGRLLAGTPQPMPAATFSITPPHGKGPAAPTSDYFLTEAMDTTTLSGTTPMGNDPDGGTSPVAPTQNPPPEATPNTTSIGNGIYPSDGHSEPRDMFMGPDSVAFLDAFDLTTSGGASDSIRSITVQASPPGVSRGAIARVEITDQARNIKGSLDNPDSEAWTIPVHGVVASGTDLMVRVRTRKVFPEVLYRLTGLVTGVEGSLGNQIQSQDSTSATITIDGRKPVPRTTTGAMTFPAVSVEVVAVQVTFDGDIPLHEANNGCTLRWGLVAGVYSETAVSTRDGNSYTALVAGLTPGTTYHFEALFTDPDGVAGTNPVHASVMTTR